MKGEKAMGLPCLIIGKSGSGKSASLRNCVGKDFAAIKAINKPFPFKGKIPCAVTDDYNKIMKALIANPAKSIVIDDAGYLITNMFMNGHSNAGAGNAVFGFYNKLADHFWNLIQFIQNSVPEDKIVYIIMHEDSDDFGNIKPKTIGKLLDEKVCVEGLFTIVLRCVSENGQHKFITQSEGGAVSKSPMGMFDSLEIDNDLALVDEKIRDYYGLNTTAVEAEKEN
jgi:hypothetical protein